MRTFADFKTYQEAQDALAAVARKMINALPMTDLTTPAGFVLVVMNPNPNGGGLHLLTNVGDNSMLAWLAAIFVRTQTGDHEAAAKYPPTNPEDN